MKKMILSAVMLVFAASGRAQEAGAASPTEHNEWLTTFEAVAVDADLDIKFVKVPDTEAPKIVYDTKGSYTSKFRAEVKDKNPAYQREARFAPSRPHRGDGLLQYVAVRFAVGRRSRVRGDGGCGAARPDAGAQGVGLTAAFDVKDLRMELTGGSSATLTGKAGYLTLFASTGRSRPRGWR